MGSRHLTRDERLPAGEGSERGLCNFETVTASAASLPLVDGSVDLVVSNYCFHHLDGAGKRRALREAHRVLRPGGRLVFGDMMFRVSVVDRGDRRVIARNVRGMVRKGPAGVWRLARNGLRLRVAGGSHRPALPWWEAALREAGFTGVHVEVLDHEGGLACARRPERR
jgi:SAM-dependent methyltransferase